MLHFFGVSLSSQRTPSEKFTMRKQSKWSLSSGALKRRKQQQQQQQKSFRRVPVALNNWCVARETRAGGVHKKRMEKRKQKQFTLKSAAGILHWDSFKVATALEQCRCRCHCRCYLVSMTISPAPANIWGSNCSDLFSFVCSSRILFMAHFFLHSIPMNLCRISSGHSLVRPLGRCVLFSFFSHHFPSALWPGNLICDVSDILSVCVEVFGCLSCAAHRLHLLNPADIIFMG